MATTYDMQICSVSSGSIAVKSMDRDGPGMEDGSGKDGLRGSLALAAESRFVEKLDGFAGSECQGVLLVDVGLHAKTAAQIKWRTGDASAKSRLSIF
jgi:hypothetical protein